VMSHQKKQLHDQKILSNLSADLKQISPLCWIKSGNLI
jgi:hypothetical protein